MNDERRTSRLRGDAGFGLVEAMIALFLAGVLGVAVINALTTSQRASTRVQNTAGVMAEARTAVDRLSRQLRPARKLLPGSDGRTLSFWLDENQDAMQDVAELHTWTVVDAGDGTARIESWTHDAPSVVRVVARDVVLADAFTYDGTLSDSRSVRIQLGFSRGATAASSSTFDVDTTVALRNAPIVEVTP